MSFFGMPVAIVWRMRSPQGRALMCDAREFEQGLELRLGYGEELIWSQQFRGPTARVDMEMRAAAWQVALIEKGFTLEADWAPEQIQ